MHGVGGGRGLKSKQATAGELHAARIMHGPHAACSVPQHWCMHRSLHAACGETGACSAQQQMHGGGNKLHAGCRSQHADCGWQHTPQEQTASRPTCSGSAIPRPTKITTASASIQAAYATHATKWAGRAVTRRGRSQRQAAWVQRTPGDGGAGAFSKEVAFRFQVFRSSVAPQQANRVRYQSAPTCKGADPEAAVLVAKLAVCIGAPQTHRGTDDRHNQGRDERGGGGQSQGLAAW